MRQHRKFWSPLQAIAILAIAFAVAGCATSDKIFSKPPSLTVQTETLASLQALPPPKRQLYVAVYAMRDQTGQNKPNDKFPEYSRALTQGARPS